MYAERLRRPIPYVDKTVYVNWNSLAISAYLQAARALGDAAMNGRQEVRQASFWNRRSISPCARWIAS